MYNGHTQHKSGVQPLTRPSFKNTVFTKKEIRGDNDNTKNQVCHLEKIQKGF